MIQLFITVIFIMELIIASGLIFNICKLDAKVITLADTVKKSHFNIQKSFRYFQFLLHLTKNRIKKFHTVLKIKREEYTLKALKTALIYISLFTLKGKYKKMILGYQFGKEIIEAIQEA